MVKTHIKDTALNLRASGVSIKEIAIKLKVSKSTVSIWCRDVALTKEAIRKISDNGSKKAIQALLHYSETKRKQRQESELLSRKAGEKKLSHLSSRDVYCIGLGLYWGEGYKRGSQEFGFTNSDPQMITFYIRWLKETFGVERNDLILRVSINKLHTYRVTEVLQYWSKLLKIPLEQFSKTSLIKTDSKKIYKNEKQHMGTLRIKVRRGTSLRREVLGALASIS